MTRSPNRYRPTDALSIAEAVFKPATPAAAEPVRVQRKSGVPVSKELVSIKLDSDLIAHFQEEGPAGRRESTMRFGGQRACKPAVAAIGRSGPAGSGLACSWADIHRR